MAHDSGYLETQFRDKDGNVIRLLTMTVDEIIGLNLRRLRNDNEMTQREMADHLNRTGVPKNWSAPKLVMYEKGDHKFTVTELFLFAETFDVSIMALIHPPDHLTEQPSTSGWVDFGSGSGAVPAGYLIANLIQKPMRQAPETERVHNRPIDPSVLSGYEKPGISKMKAFYQLLVDDDDRPDRETS